MSGLTEQDRETLARSMGAHWDRVIGMNPMGEWQATDADLVDAIASDIEAIVVRHVRAALTEAAERIEHLAPGTSPWAIATVVRGLTSDLPLLSP